MKDANGMTKILVLFHSWTGHLHKMAMAVAEGAGRVDGCDVVLKQVPEIVSDEVLERAGATEPRKAFADIPVATVEELPDYDGFAFGSPTRFGNMSATMRSFLDQTGRYYLSGELVDKVATVFCGTGSGGGQETTITSFWNTLAHQGMLIMPLGYRDQTIRDMSAANGGSPYGACCFARGEGERPSEKELIPARTQGESLAGLAKRLSAAG